MGNALHAKVDWRETSGYLLIIFASCFFGGSASLGKSLMKSGMSTVMLMETRSIITSLVLLPLLFLFGRKHLKLRRTDWLSFVLLGIPGIALVNASYYYAVKTLTVALAVFLQFTAPVLVFLYGWASRKEAPSREKMAALLFSLAGTYFMLRLHSTSTGNIPLIGVVSAIVSTVAYAFYVILSHQLGKRYSAWTIIFYGYTIAALFWCIVQNPFETATLLSHKDLWTGALLFSLISTLIPFTLFLNGLRRVTPTGATIASTTETIAASVFAYLILGESLTAGQLGGAILIVSAILLLAYRKKEPAAELSLTL
jgi:drug/metabolite transporter (DMT)-like permease